MIIINTVYYIISQLIFGPSHRERPKIYPSWTLAFVHILRPQPTKIIGSGNLHKTRILICHTVMTPSSISHLAGSVRALPEKP